MPSPASLAPVIFAVFAMALVGCNRTDNTTVDQPKPAADAAKPESTKPDLAKAELVKTVDVDRRAAEWVLRVDGSIRAVVDGVPREIKKGENLPAGPIKLVSIDLRNSPKATDDGRVYLRGLNGLQELAINDSANIRNLDFLADMTGLQVLNSEGQSPLITDKDLVHIKEMTYLKSLTVVSQAQTNPALTDNVFAVVNGLKQLEQLRLCNCSVTDEGVRQLDGHGSLQFLDFWRTKVGDAGLASLASLPKLQQIAVLETQVTDTGVKAFQAKLPNCRVIK